MDYHDFSSISGHLNYTIDETNPVMALFIYIPFITYIYSKTLFGKLSHIIYHWINKANHHHHVKNIILVSHTFFFEFVFFREINFSFLINTCWKEVDLFEGLDKIVKYNNIQQMNTRTNIMIFTSIVIPFEFY